MADYYAVLGVPKTATKDDIKKAYRKAALKTHPDRVPQEQKKAAEDSFRAVNAAYEILADDKKKALYDKHGVWPPPATSNSTGYKPRPSQPEYKPFGSSSQPQPPFFDESGAFQGFVFTDPFTLFNMMFGAEFVQSHVPFHAAYPHSRPVRTPAPMFDGQQYMQQPMFQQQFQSFAQAGATATASFTQPTATGTSTAAPPSSATNTPRSVRSARSESTASPKDNEDRGWIKESKVTKVTPQGTRETTVKKTAADGTVYITRVAGDGVIRHWIAVNGVETPTDRGAPEIAPTPRVPLSQTQPQVPPSQPRPAAYAAAPQQPQQPQQPQPPSSSRHAPSASQPVNSAYDAQAAYSRAYPQAPPSGSDGHRRSASRAGHHERSASRAGHHERSASRAGHHERPPSRSAQHERAYRATSPPPVPPKENKATPTPSPTGSYPFAYPQAPPAAVPQRAKSPSPRQEAGRAAEREKEKDLRRNHTVPSHVLSAQAAPPMPRPQSPHFYRTRTNSESGNPSPTKSNSTSSSATQQPRSRYDSVTGQGTRMTEEPASYVFSDTEAARVRSSTNYRPSRSSNTVPVPAPQPMTQSVPTVAPSASAPRRSSSRYGHQHSQSMQAATAAPTRHHSVPAPQQVPMTITNELGLGFVPPPSSGLGSSRNSGASAGPNPPLGHSSRNPSFEEIIYPYNTQPKSSSRSHQQAYGNPLPNPPASYREPWTAEAQQQARYRQAAV